VADQFTGYDARAELESLIERELLGPWDGPAEELPAGTSPGERYLLGKLVPRRPDEAEPITAEDAADDDDVEDRPELVDDGGVGLDLEAQDTRPSTAAVRGRAMAASSIGLAFVVPEDVDSLVVRADWGRYERRPSSTQETDAGRPRITWQREPAGGEVAVPVDREHTDRAIPDTSQEQVVVQWRVRHRDSRRVIEVFLRNLQPVQAEMPDRHRLFQVALTVTAADGGSAIFAGHNDPDLPELRRDSDDELRLLALQHRAARLFGTGRQCAVDADVHDGQARAWRLRTTCFPAADVLAVVPGDPSTMPGVELDMRSLGSLDRRPDDLVRVLRPMADGYRAWLTEQSRLIDTDPEIARFADVARPALDRAFAVADRLDRAIDLLGRDAQALEAFRFANQAMARQRVRSEFVRRRAAETEVPSAARLKALFAEVDVPANRSWRPFQLAFVLLCIPGLTDPTNRDAQRGPLLDGCAQLLFFPTGGGKTEAYLGLTAYTIAIRRLQGVVGDGLDGRDGTRGLGVLMRYTLRLLTAQQFQRATALISACELLRRERVRGGDTRWGDTPIRVGLWVGSGVTPNTYDDAQRQLEDARGQGDRTTGGLQQFSTCPWCGSAINLGRDGHDDRARRRVLLFCGDPDGSCPFSRAQADPTRPEGLPAIVIDEEIYRLAPDLLIGTVDKFAALPWLPSTAHLFGNVRSECDRHGFRPADETDWCRNGGHTRTSDFPSTQPVAIGRLRPPDLIIQDELHLISDALGSMVGLYETLLDALCTRQHRGQSVRPVLVASTATVRRARAQVQQVFARDLTVFPPPLFDAGKTFFSSRAQPSPDTPARRYRGILAPGERLTAVEIRVMTALLEFGQLLFDKHGNAVDPYMTVVDYFSSTRDLASMRRLTEDDVTDRLGRQSALVRRRIPTIAELTSRMDSGKITQSLADLERRFDVAQDSTSGQQALRALRKSDEQGWRDAIRPATERPIDVLLATSMLQVGVDVQRLGLMVVTGQPKNMAEYIQASSRVGRSKDGPGLVLTIFQWNRPRDLAHFEHFGHEHVTFGRRVEGLTTTPFSKRALDRGLAGVLVGAVRHCLPGGLPNLGAHTVPLDATAVGPLLDLLRRRAELVADSHVVGVEVADRAQAQLDKWLHRRTTLPAGQLGYRAQPQVAELLREPDDPPWDEWSAPRSLRDVEPEICLQLRREDPSWQVAPAWDFAPLPGSPAGTVSDQNGDD
jgi:hypothetical protein